VISHDRLRSPTTPSAARNHQMPKQSNETIRLKILEILELDDGPAQWFSDQASLHGMKVDGYLRHIVVSMYMASRLAPIPFTGVPKLVDQTKTTEKTPMIDPNAKVFNTASGFKGVYPYAGKWSAAFVRKGQRCQVGVYDTPEEAARAYDDAMDARGEPRANFLKDDRSVMKALEHPPELDAVAAAHREQAERNAALHRQIKNHNRIEPDETITMLSSVTEEDYARWAAAPLPSEGTKRDPNEIPDRTPIVDDPGPPRLIPVRRQRAAALNQGGQPVTPTIVKSPENDLDPNRS
jgi:hypothetical protein